MRSSLNVVVFAGSLLAVSFRISFDQYPNSTLLEAAFCESGACKLGGCRFTTFQTAIQLAKFGNNESAQSSRLVSMVWLSHQVVTSPHFKITSIFQTKATPLSMKLRFRGL